jgi:hypothetical protein
MPRNTTTEAGRLLKRRDGALTRARRRMIDVEFREKENKRLLILFHRHNTQTRTKAIRYYHGWLPSEERVTQDIRLTVTQCVAILGRTMSAIRNRREKWRRELGLSFVHLRPQPRFSPFDLSLTRRNIKRALADAPFVESSVIYKRLTRELKHGLNI